MKRYKKISVIILSLIISILFIGCINKKEEAVKDNTRFTNTVQYFAVDKNKHSLQKNDAVVELVYFYAKDTDNYLLNGNNSIDSIQIPGHEDLVISDILVDIATRDTESYSFAILRFIVEYNETFTTDNIEIKMKNGDIITKKIGMLSFEVTKDINSEMAANTKFTAEARPEQTYTFIVNNDNKEEIEILDLGIPKSLFDIKPLNKNPIIKVGQEKTMEYQITPKEKDVFSFYFIPNIKFKTGNFIGNEFGMRTIFKPDYNVVDDSIFNRTEIKE